MLRLEIPDGVAVQLHIGRDQLALPAPAPAPPSRRVTGRRLFSTLAVLGLVGGAFQLGRWTEPSGETVPPALAAATAPASAAAQAPAPQLGVRPPLAGLPRAAPEPPAAPGPAPEQAEIAAALRRALQQPPVILPAPGSPDAAGAPAPGPSRNRFGLQVPSAP